MSVDVQFNCEILSLSYKCDVKLKICFTLFFLKQRLTEILILIEPTNFSSYLLIRCSIIGFDNIDFYN